MAIAVRRPRRPAREPGPIRRVTDETGDLIAFGGQVLRHLPGSVRYSSEMLRQTAIMLRGTWFLMFVLNLFLGMSVVTFAFFVLRSLGAGEFVGLFTGYITPRQTAPTMFGYVMAGKVCCGIAAELGAMRIQQEIDALDSTGVDPFEYVIGTRVGAVILFTPIACAIALFGSLAGNYLDAVLVLQGTSKATFSTLNWSGQGIAEQIYALASMMAIAVPCAIVACFYGMRTAGGPAGVGHSSAKSLTLNLVLVHVITALAGVMYYLPSPKLGFGR
jgi:phospholipid/cholesterol/gamma-HCH transport system permease protein